MEERILAHEKMMQEKVKAGRVDKATLAYHRWMIANFQHERMVHLIVMLTFVVLTLALIGLSAWLSWVFTWGALWPIYLATLLMVVVSFFYVKHYYFLENHIQKLYDLVPLEGKQKA